MQSIAGVFKWRRVGAGQKAAAFCFVAFLEYAKRKTVSAMMAYICQPFNGSFFITVRAVNSGKPEEYMKNSNLMSNLKLQSNQEIYV